MKKILLFGRLNDITKDMNAYFSRYFQVQLCSDSLEIAKGMMKVYVPDLVIISLVGLYEIHSGFFNHLYENYRDTPVITIGTEQDMVLFKSYYKNDQFRNIIRPVDHTRLMQEICQRLFISMEKLLKDYERQMDRRKHVLLVDDDAVFLRTMKEALQANYQISVAISAAQAMTIIGKRKPDLVILDYDMPVCNGKMMLEMIRSEARLKEVPVIFLTGISQKEHIMEVVALKPEGYFLKPPVLEELCAAMERILKKREEEGKA